jgi:toxin HigB-1
LSIYENRKYHHLPRVTQSFADRETEKIWNRQRSRKLPTDIQDRALRKLRELAAAPTLETLRFPPSNRHHPLSGDRKDSHAIRINDQWRITFTWGAQGPDNVSIEDYH